MNGVPRASKSWQIFGIDTTKPRKVGHGMWLAFLKYFRLCNFSRAMKRGQSELAQSRFDGFDFLCDLEVAFLEGDGVALRVEVHARLRPVTLKFARQSPG